MHISVQVARAALAVVTMAALGLTATGCARTVTGLAAPAAEPAVGSAPAAPGPAPTTTTAADGYTVRTAEFSLTFPGKPQESTRPLPQDPSLVLHFYVYQPLGRYSLNAGYIDYPKGIALGDPAAVLQNVARGAVGAVPGGKLTSSTPTTVDGRPALDVVGEASGGTVLARFALDGRRLYEVITAGEGDVEATHEAFAKSLVIN